MLKKLRRRINNHAKPIIYSILVALGGGFVLLYRLGSLTKGMSPAEVTTLSHSLSLRVLFKDPLNLPLTLLQWASLHISRHHYFLARLPSAVFGIIAIICLAYILQRWYGRRAALLGLLLVAASSWFLHVSRAASPDVLYFCALPALLTSHLLLRDYPNKFFVRLLWFVTHSMLLFVPGLVWLVVLNSGLQHKELWNIVRHLGSWWKATVLGLAVVMLLGYLGYALARQPHLLKEWAGLPAQWGPWKLHGTRLLQSISYFVVRGPATPAVWLGRLPILDAIGTLFLLTGLIFYTQHVRAPRSQLLAIFFVLGALLFAANGPVSFSLLVPIVYIIAVAGIAYLLHAWLKVFPRNPLARGVGIGVVCAAIALSMTYNLRAYFVAWPKNDDTRAVMNHLPPYRSTKN